MVKRKRKRKTKYRYVRRIRRSIRRRKPKISVELALAGMSIPFTPPADGYTDYPAQAISDGRFKHAMEHMKIGFMGMKPTGEIDNLGAVLNPFDMSTARYWKMLMIAGLMGKVRKKLVPQSTLLVKRIPMIGRYLK